MDVGGKPEATPPATADAVMTNLPDSATRNEQPESLQDAVDATLVAVEATATTMAALRAEKEQIAFTLQTTLSKLRAENVALRQKFTETGIDAAASPTESQARVDEAKALEERVKTLEADLSEQRLAHAQLEREKLDGEQALVAKMRQSADDGALIQGLRGQVTELMQARAAASASMAAQSEAGAALVREAGEHAAAAAGAAKRVEFLESERVRLSSAVAEARSRHEIAAGEAAARAQATEAAARSLRGDLDGARKRADKLAAQVNGLTETVESLQRQRDQSRASALEEVRRMKDIMSARIEAAEDAEARAEKYKRLLQTVSDSNAQIARPTSAEERRSLDEAAEALLRDMQATLDEKLADLAEQRVELERARVERVKMAGEFQGLVRAASEARTERDQAVAMGQAATSTVAELKKRVSELEERILLAASPHLSIRTPGSVYGGSLMMTPRVANVSPGGMDIDDDDPESISGALSVMKRVQQKHESVLASLRRREATPSN